jgi:hypothetical protein
MDCLQNNHQKSLQTLEQGQKKRMAKNKKNKKNKKKLDSRGIEPRTTSKLQVAC